MKKIFSKLSQKRHLSLIGLGLVFAAGGFLIAGQLAGNSRAKTAQQNDCAVAACVALAAEGATPDTVTVNVGESVQFNSADGKTHSLSNGLGGEEHDHSGPFSSGDFGADEGWRVEFKQPGTFKFHDHYNPAINILVVAYQPGNVEPIKP